MKICLKRGEIIAFCGAVNCVSYIKRTLSKVSAMLILGITNIYSSFISLALIFELPLKNFYVVDIIAIFTHSDKFNIPQENSNIHFIFNFFNLNKNNC
jgi:hypothetical protein